MKYAGYTRKQLRSAVKKSRASEEGLGSLLGGDEIVCDVIEAILNHLKELKPGKPKVATPSKVSKTKTTKIKSAAKSKKRKAKVVKFPSFD